MTASALWLAATELASDFSPATAITLPITSRWSRRGGGRAAGTGSRLLDGEAIVTDQSGLAVFDLIRGQWSDAPAVLCAFDLLELDGEDLRRAPIEERKAALARLLRRPIGGIAFNEHYSGDGAIIFRRACKLGCEGIVSKRLGSAYQFGRVVSWLKVKNPAAPAVTREAEEE
jgi:ATP-dependent DNA ligase